MWLMNHVIKPSETPVSVVTKPRFCKPTKKEEAKEREEISTFAKFGVSSPSPVTTKLTKPVTAATDSTVKNISYHRVANSDPQHIHPVLRTSQKLGWGVFLILPIFPGVLQGDLDHSIFLDLLYI